MTISWLILTSSKLQAQQAVSLQKNELTPYAGILAPFGYIQDLERRSALADFYKTELNKNKDCLPELSSFEPPVTNHSSFFLGALAGGAIVAIIALLVTK